MEVECALLEGEQESEMAQLQREKELLNQLKEKNHSTEKKSHTEKSQVKICKMVKPGYAPLLVCPSLGIQRTVVIAQ